LRQALFLPETDDIFLPISRFAMFGRDFERL
jgi:hypothetical protein